MQTLMLALARVVLVLPAAALAKNIVGSNGPNRLIGTGEDDYIAGRSGDDRIEGRGGDDRLYGGRGNDILVVVGGGRDFIDCGPGFDRAYVDNSDRVSSDCERVYRSSTAPSPPRRAARGDLGQVACASATGGGREAVIACLESL
jgi:hypothetical protein